MNRRGFNRNGLRNGLDSEGFHGKTGFDKDGFNKEGYNNAGRDREGYDRQGYDTQGYCRDGFNRQGRNREGLCLSSSGYRQTQPRKWVPYTVSIAGNILMFKKRDGTTSVLSMSSGVWNDTQSSTSSHTQAAVGLGTVYSCHSYLDLAVYNGTCVRLVCGAVRWCMYGDILLWSDRQRTLHLWDIRPLCQTTQLPPADDCECTELVDTPSWVDTTESPFPVSFSHTVGTSVVHVALSASDLSLVGLAVYDCTTGKCDVRVTPGSGTSLQSLEAQQVNVSL
ncbi:hypothetical protein KIPB_007365 [Kipferlia bialata]|uniref:Uncharacterized protein n=1 Tax=Kipferlia bialata TaxID=797122 RepID=A0A391NMH2_9EUKA|nr:hypothetical protein KIPB_007365 [Kipferlia bialata]|eukprot:g7365.t1